jgi:succinyl-CoA:acetate CoA-transferase
MPLMTPHDRIGTTAIEIPADKIVAIVFTEKLDSSSTILPPDAETAAIAAHLVEFFKGEVAQGRLTESLLPMQAGIGTIANAVMGGFIDSPFKHLTMYSEVLQDSTFDLFDAGKLDFASGSSITLSSQKSREVFGNIGKYMTGWCCARRRSATTPKSSGVWASSPSTPRWRPISTATSTQPMCWART